ncbi:hypothetical protein Glove_102g35 [Diversispora epigaea]|uniref:Uncharacterized protein n=1 Tax=Diversispora epigaea TaxID=1348612 RepID=A0A397JCL4_9GLOM|nr:hypothetical protein Glove_102g35 [Diversispora epigaea]
MIDKNDENSYYNNTIMKYMTQPHLPEFENLIYLQYFERYSIIPSSPSSTNRQIYQDDLNNYIVKRSKEIIIKYRFFKIEDGELYFYQQLLLKVLTISEYSIIPSSPSSTNRQIYQDDLNNYIVKRSKEIIIKYRFFKIEDGELYFYQQLLLKVLTISELDYKIKGCK